MTEEKLIAEKTLSLAKKMAEISIILSQPKLTKEDKENLKRHLNRLHTSVMGRDVGLSADIAAIARAAALKLRIETEKPLPEAEIVAFGNGAHATFPKSMIGKKIKYYPVE